MNIMAQRTKEDVIADAARFDEPARSILIALGEFQLSIPIDQSCLFCRSAIHVWLPNPKVAAWQISCDCGKCNSTFRGL